MVENCTKTVTCADHNTTQVLANACGDNEECQIVGEGVMDCENGPSFFFFFTTRSSCRRWWQWFWWWWGDGQGGG